MRFRRFCACGLLGVMVVAAGCTAGATRLDHGLVVAPEPHAAEVGAAVLAAGGNAVDAAVSVQFALAVTYPIAGNLGGGGFMLIYDPAPRRRAPAAAAKTLRPFQSVSALDYRETAPTAATRDMFLDARGEVVPDLSLRSHLAAGVPGSVRGMWEAHQCFGRRPWRELVEPAIRLAADGFVLDDWTARSFARQADEVAKLAPRYRDAGNFAAYFHGRAGERFTQPELAETLRRIAEQGADGFYTGRTAELIVAEMRRGGGLITSADLRDYRAVWRPPVQGRYRGYSIVSMPTPSSGGIALLQLLAVAECHPLPPRQSAVQLHLFAEIEKRVFADRAAFLGDPDFYLVPTPALLNQDYLARRSAEIVAAHKSDPGAIRPGPFQLDRAPPARESEQTTHFSIVDRRGMAVANTTTLNDGYGSGIVVTGAGFLLNNEMDDFSAKPGAPNMYGVTGGEANAIEPGKRMLSSMTPTFVFDRDGKLRLIVGTPGGPTIFTTVFQIIVNRIDYGLPLAEAVAAPRFHHQWPPPPDGGDPIWIEKSPPDWLPTAAREALVALGYEIRTRGAIGDVQAIEIVGRRPVGASDPRGIGAVREEPRPSASPAARPPHSPSPP
jgi:gamma-glutamyltranspeptidase/glutathione hydrolase